VKALKVFEISITENKLENFWYTIDNGAHKYSITEFTDTISQNAWNLAPKGPVTIRFYALDLTGNTGMNSVIIAKTSEEQNPHHGIPGYNIYFLLGCISLISAIFINRNLQVEPL
jgi:hypothetical protein